MGLSGISQPVRAALAAVVVVGGSALAQIPDVGSSAEGRAAVPAAMPTVSPNPPAAPSTPAASPPPAEPNLTIASGTARSVNFNAAAPDPADSKKQVLIADLGLVLQVPKDHSGRIEATFLATADGSREPLAIGLHRVPPGHAAFYADRSLPMTVGGESIPLALHFAIPADTPARLADGEVQLALEPAQGTQPQSVDIAGGAPTATVAPNPVTLRVTRTWGPLAAVVNGFRDNLSQATTTATLTGTGAEALAMTASGATGPLASERTSHLEAALGHAGAGDRGSFDVPVRVDEAKLTGKFTGSIPLAPETGSTTTIPVEVQVQDGFWWPLIVLAIFGFLGGYLVQHHNLNRRRAILQNTLRERIQSYRKAQAELPEIEPVDEVLIGVEPLYPTRSECRAKPRSLGHVGGLFCDIDDCKSDEEFTAAAARVAEVLAPIDRWERRADAYRALEAALTETAVPDDDPARQDAEGLLVTAAVDPETADAVTALLDRMRGQRLILPEYAALRDAWDALSDAKKAASPELDPANVYKREAGRDKAATLALRVALATAERRARDLKKAPDVVVEELKEVTGPGGVAILARATAAAAASRVPLSFFQEGATAEPASQAAAPPRDTHRILSRVKWWDGVIATITVLLTAVAYLLPKYGTHTFGSWEDYLQLAAVAFLGSIVTGGLVLNWELFPSLRSYEVSASTQPAARGAPE